MTRALGIALVFVATLGAIVVGYFTFAKRSLRERREPESVAEPPVERVTVLAGQTPDRAVLVKRRFADAARAEFTDRSLSRALGAPEDRWTFVEVWVVNRDAEKGVATGSPPKLRASGGSTIALVPLADISADLAAAPGRVRTLVSALSGDREAPVRKGALRRSVYALPRGIVWSDLTSAAAYGVELLPRETTEDDLEGFLESPTGDLIAALTNPQAGPETRSRIASNTEESR